MPWADETGPGGAPLGAGREIELPGRGTTYVREFAGPMGAPTVVLLHGLGVDADLNWFGCSAVLADHFRVLTIDHRGHGRGIRDRQPFTLAACADDVAALCEVLDIERVVPVGYSMGGPIAQLLWYRHRALVQGLVLCATAARFGGSPARRASFALAPLLAASSRLGPRQLPPNPLARQLLRARFTDPATRAWVAERRRRLDAAALLQAGAAVGRFSSRRWIGDVDVPTSVVITQFDRAVPRSRQESLAAAIPGAAVHRVAGDHAVCVTRPDLFAPVLLDACRSATEPRPAAANGR